MNSLTPAVQKKNSGKGGQSLIETCIALALICLLFFGLFQISQLFAARQILAHAAARGCRAKTVGFNWWMVEKCIRVASIPNAGRMIEPAFVNEDPLLRNMLNTLRPGDLWDAVIGITPSSQQYSLESVRIPEYMQSYNRPRAGYILDYEDWDSVRGDHDSMPPPDDSVEVIQPFVEIRATQRYPLRIPMHRVFYADDHVNLSAQASLENHYPLYLNDMYW